MAPRGAGRRRAGLVVLALALVPSAAAQTAPARRGPIEAREEWLLAQPRLTLPALSPDLLAPGRSELRLHFDWGNDFGWRQDVAGEDPGERLFLVDGEHRTLELHWRRGLRPALEFDVRVPLRWRGPGLLDGVIDWFHGFTRRLGLPENERPRFARDRLRVDAQAPDGQPLEWTGHAGTGLGRIELAARVALTAAARGHGASAAPPSPATAGARGGSRAATTNAGAAGPRRGWAVAFVPRVTLPTGSAPFDVPGLEAGAQLVAARGLGGAWDVYLGAGGTLSSGQKIEGLPAPRGRAHGFVAFEWRPVRRLSLLAQFDAASRLVDGVADYPGVQSYVRLGAQLDVGGRWRLAGGFTENIADQQSTTDFGIFLALARRF